MSEDRRDVRVLVVEDEEVAAAAHAAYVERVPGFALAGVARSARDALVALRAAAGPEAVPAGKAGPTAGSAAGPIDLVLLDMNLPDGHGLDLVVRMRAEGVWCDVIAVTAARDVDVVRRAVAQGVVLYLLKPFTYASFRSKLEQYADYRARISTEAADGSGGLGQDEVDRALSTLRPGYGAASGLPKGMSSETLRAVRDALRSEQGGHSASEVGARTGASRVTARRYLEYLASEGLVSRRTRYGGTGRPEMEYHWDGA